jgi:hypothetical protein
VVPLHQRLAAADPQDWRAVADLEENLNEAAAGFQDAADPALAVAGDDRRRNLEAAEKLLNQVAAIMERAMKHAPSNESWRAVQADAQVRLGSVRSILHTAGDSAVLAKKGIAALKDIVKKDQVSPTILDQAARAFLRVEPASLRNPQLAVQCAERASALSHGKSPSLLLTLSQANRAAGRLDKSRAMAKEGLALLPTPQAGSRKPRVRTLLEIEARPGF